MICDSLLEPVDQMMTQNADRCAGTPEAGGCARVGRKAAALPILGLASRSPRRRLLLDEAGVRHVVVDSGVDDSQLSPGDVRPEAWVVALAYLKAAAGVRNVSLAAAPVGGLIAGGVVAACAGPRILLGADTVVVHRGGIIGQPRDAADAERIVRLLADDEHDVITGVALIDLRGGDGLRSGRGGGRDLLVDRAKVWVGPLSEDQIVGYVASGAWRGKAGAYNLSERLEAGWPIRYEGDPGTIMGLPMGILLPRLSRFA